jgi:hypothetical protein
MLNTLVSTLKQEKKKFQGKHFFLARQGMRTLLSVKTDQGMTADRVTLTEVAEETTTVETQGMTETPAIVPQGKTAGMMKLLKMTIMAMRHKSLNYSNKVNSGKTLLLKSSRVFAFYTIVMLRFWFAKRGFCA